MSRPLMLYIPDDTRALTISVVVKNPDDTATDEEINKEVWEYFAQYLDCGWEDAEEVAE